MTEHITPKKCVNRDKCDFATHQRMFKVLGIVEILCYGDLPPTKLLTLLTAAKHPSSAFYRIQLDDTQIGGWIFLEFAKEIDNSLTEEISSELYHLNVF